MNVCSVLSCIILWGVVVSVHCQGDDRWKWQNNNPQQPIFGQGPPRQPSQFDRQPSQFDRQPSQFDRQPPRRPFQFDRQPPRQPFNPRPTPPPVATTTATNPGLDGNRQLIGCPCVSTPEVNLACGTDGNAYGNLAKLRCAQRCGHNVELAHLGNCRARDLLTPAQRMAAQRRAALENNQ